MRLTMMLALILALPAAAPAPRPTLRVERAVILMRHGVRPPTKAPPMPAGVADQAWPDWPVAPGYLTPHGAAAVRLVAGWDREAWRAAGLLPRKGCAKVRIVADSDQRTIATGAAYAQAIAPGCPVEQIHKPQDVADPLFSPIDEGAVTIDAEAARAAVIAQAGPGGIAGEDARLRALLARLDAVLCAGKQSGCGVGHMPSALAAAKPLARPKLVGALDRASTAAQILLLEYAEGKPLDAVGWGRASRADIAAFSEFHAVEFRLLARPNYVARRNLALIGPLMLAALTDQSASAVTMISGHDTNVASLGGLLDLHWQVPGLAADDPSPGGAIVFERLVDGQGRRFVRVSYRSQTLEQIRGLARLDRQRPYLHSIALPGCGGVQVCPLARFEQLMRERLAHD